MYQAHTHQTLSGIDTVQTDVVTVCSVCGRRHDAVHISRLFICRICKVIIHLLPEDSIDLFGIGIIFILDLHKVIIMGKETVLSVGKADRNRPVILLCDIFYLLIIGSDALEYLRSLCLRIGAVRGKALIRRLLCGCSACIGQFGITQAYLLAPAKEISVYDYTQILFAAALGYIFFRQIPDGWSVVGYVLICGAGVGMFLYNRHMDHKAAR